MRSAIVILVTAAALAVGGTASAAVLVTPPATPIVGDGFNCQVANVSSKPVTIDAQAFRHQTLLDSTGPQLIQPGNVLRLSVVVTTSSIPHWCRFVVKGGKATVRAGASVNSGGINGGRDVLLSPAQ